MINILNLHSNFHLGNSLKVQNQVKRQMNGVLAQLDNIWETNLPYGTYTRTKNSRRAPISKDVLRFSF